MKNLIRRLVRDTEGQDLVEYALLAGLIGLATSVSMTALSGSISTEFGKIGTTITTAS
jgi:pilus assembly protein Flp/PilA